jgi:hypothetical protein
MTSTTIQQCSRCRRFFVEGEIISISIGDGLAAARSGQLEQCDCARPDCAAVAAANAQRDAERQRQVCRRSMQPARRQARSNQPHPACPEPPLPRHSVRGPDAATGVYGAVASPAQADFEASGAADNQNAVLIEFFSDPKTHGKLFPMVYLQEISGAQRMNNRAIDLRKHFRPLGFGLWNEMRPYGPTGAMHSHYGLFTLDEIHRKEADLAEAQEQRRGQAKLV